MSCLSRLLAWCHLISTFDATVGEHFGTDLRLVQTNVLRTTLVDILDALAVA